jgi:hypothetical protein
MLPFGFSHVRQVRSMSLDLLDGRKETRLQTASLDGYISRAIARRKIKRDYEMTIQFPFLRME